MKIKKIKEIKERITGKLFRQEAESLIPSIKKVKVKKFAKKSKYETVFIDFRIIPHIEFLIRNVIHKFDSNWSHTIVCGNLNYNYMKQLAESISSNINIIKLNLNNLNQKSYSELLQTEDFWNLFQSEKIFLYQEDSLVFKDNIKDFLDFVYIGAPWGKNRILGGNGGCCLRSRKVMLECLKKEEPYFPEDIYYCKTVLKYNLGKLPPYEISMKFGEENVNSNDIPFCGHQFWKSGNKKLLKIKDMECFKYLILYQPLNN